jgi:hypothetical protein
VGGLNRLRAAGCLEQLWATWSDPMVAPAERERLTRVAARLPPSPRLGLELQLGAPGAPVDLHQLILAEEDGREIVRDHLARTCAAEGDAGAQAYRRFLGAWAQDDRLAGAFPEIFLEHDLPGGAEAERPPSVFFDLDARRATADAGRRREALAFETLAAIAAASPLAWPRRAPDVLRALRNHGRPGHLGVMFGRAQAGLRINVRGVAYGALAPLLAELGWSGDRDAAAAAFDRLADAADRVTVAFDLAPDLQPRIGFECFVDGAPSRDFRWGRLLDALVAEGLCAPAVRSALLAFPAVFRPASPGPGAWPADWVVAAVRAPADVLPHFSRRLSHVKLTLGPDGARQAKAYVGVHHEWDRRRPDDARVHAPRCGGGRAAKLTTQVESVIGETIDYLAGRCAQGGFWRDFRLDIGFSDEWATAFIACQLALSGRPRAEAVARRGLDWLLRRQRPGGWGYNGTSPPDADSTAWALKLADALGAHGEAVAAARKALRAHVAPDGGVSTYASQTPINFRGRRLEDDDARGWRGRHDCVAANAASPAGEPRIADRLRARQRPDGAWTAHWWRSDLFATALAAEALAAAPQPGDAARISRAIGWASGETAAAANGFDLACYLWLGAGRLSPHERERATRRLLSLRSGAGAWPGGAAMQFPLPWETERRAETPPVVDQEGLFTTAAALGALLRAYPGAGRPS